jgi:uncharacterized OB-fold protein
MLSTMRIKLPTLRCRRCGHRWIPSQAIIRMCPKCKSEGWETKRTTRQGTRTDLKKEKKR